MTSSVPAQAITQLRRQITKLARSQAPVHIHGESGSGKEVVARLIHNNGPRAAGAFVAVNCGAIPAELMESELFGHTKGSFTGASQDKIGLFQAAAGGTLFLDEVADLPLAMQVKLLRAIQEKAVRPVGANAEVATDVRLLSATHKNLAKEVEAGRFRNDLFYRINVIDVYVPSLRERIEDVPELAEALLQRITREDGGNPPVLEQSAIAALCGYNFPGNVRELENMLERAMALSDGAAITADDLQFSGGTAQRSAGTKTIAGTDAVDAADGPTRTAADTGPGYRGRLRQSRGLPGVNRKTDHQQGPGGNPLEPDRDGETAGDQLPQPAVSVEEVGVGGLARKRGRRRLLTSAHARKTAGIGNRQISPHRGGCTGLP